MNVPAPILELAIPDEGFDPSDRRWYVLGAKTCADLPTSPGGTGYDPWQIAGDTSAAPDGTNDETGLSDYPNAAANEPGHVWPYMNLGATLRSTLASTIEPFGYFPACQPNEGINHYRRFVRLAPGMFGYHGRFLWLRVPGRIKATNARDCIDVVLHHDLVTATPATTFTAGKYTGFRWVVGNLGANEVACELEIVGQAMGPFKSNWWGRLVVAAQTNPESTAAAIDSRRGPITMDLTGTGPNMDTAGSQLALLIAARGNAATSFDTIGSAGGAAQDGSEVYLKMGAGLCLLSPGQ